MYVFKEPQTKNIQQYKISSKYPSEYILKLYPIISQIIYVFPWEMFEPSEVWIIVSLLLFCFILFSLSQSGLGILVDCWGEMQTVCLSRCSPFYVFIESDHCNLM